LKSVYGKIRIDEKYSVNGPVVTGNQCSILIAETIFTRIAGGNLGGVIYATMTQNELLSRTPFTLVLQNVRFS
jgi:hypothetical protein